jgi:hypothetical protein
MQTPKDNSLNVGRDNLPPALFAHAPKAPSRSDDAYGYQCLFGGSRHVVQRYTTGGWVQAGVYRDSEKDLAELSVVMYMADGGKQETYLKMNADDMQTMACAMLDAAHHLRTVPAEPYVWLAKSEAQEVAA